MSDLKEVKLQGRIYPAIKSCVGNRYKIIIGIFSYYGFLLSEWGEGITKLHTGLTSLLVPVVFMLFALHNTINYVANAKEQYRYEYKKKIKGFCCCFEFIFCKNKMEWISCFIILLIIYCGYHFLIWDC